MGFGKQKGRAGKIDEAILFSLRRISNVLMQHSREFTMKYALSPSQVLCLRLLMEGGPLTSSELARGMYLSHGTITWMVDRLEAAGLVLRSRENFDRRKVTVSLTEMGRRTAKQVPLALQGKFSSELAALPPAKQEVISGVLDQILEMMELPET